MTRTNKTLSIDLLALLYCLSGLQVIKPTQSLNNGLALTPPMGWLAWERFVCETNCTRFPDQCIDYKLFQEMADRLVSDGFFQVGYQYINIDDCWSTRDRDTRTNSLLPDPQRFHSMKGLADHVHSLGLKLGIYGDCGTETCQRFPGQLKYNDSLVDNYFQLDAETFAGWGIDSFKFDGCFLDVHHASKLCPDMETALNRTGRAILFSCSWPAYENDEKISTNWSLVVEKCNLWRAFGDIEDSWKSVLDTIDYFVDQQDLVVKFHGPGHWFDADQLVIGNYGLSFEQERAQMAVWCIWAAPLYMSNDLRLIRKESSKILRNKWAIAVNQDRLGIFGLMVDHARQIQVFVKPIEPIIDSCPSYAIVYLNRQTLGNWRVASFKLSDLISSVHAKLAQSEKWSHWVNCWNRSVLFNVYDLFEQFTFDQALRLNTDYLALPVNPSGVRMVQLIAQKL